VCRMVGKTKQFETKKNKSKESRRN
jgi:hypothetical protein